MPWPDDPADSGLAFQNPSQPANMASLAPPPGTDPFSAQAILKQLIPTLALGAGAALTSPIRSAPMIAGRAILGAASGYASAQPKPITDKDLYYRDRLQMSELKRKEWQTSKAARESYADTLPENDKKAYLSMDAKGQTAFATSRMHRQMNQALLTKAGSDLKISPAQAEILNQLPDNEYNKVVAHFIEADHKRSTQIDPYTRGFQTAQGRLDAERREKDANRTQAQGLRDAATHLRSVDPNSSQAQQLEDDADKIDPPAKGTKEETILLNPETMKPIGPTDDASKGVAYRVRLGGNGQIQSVIGRPPTARGEIDPVVAKQIANAIANGTRPPDMKGLYRYGPAVSAELAKQGIDLTTMTKDWQAVTRNIASMNNQQQLRLRQAVEFTSESTKRIEQLFSDWKRLGGASGYPLFNKAALYASRQVPGELGATAQALEAQINDLTGELSNVYMGGGVPTEQAMKLAAKNLQADFNEDQFKKSLETLRNNLRIRRNSLEQAPIGVSAGSKYAGETKPPTAEATPSSPGRVQWGYDAQGNLVQQ